MRIRNYITTKGDEPLGGDYIPVFFYLFFARCAHTAPMGYYFFMSLSEEKIKAVASSARFFRHIPFADFAVLSGSCASGQARTDSDIDIIVGARTGRVWTARFFTLLFADIRGVRHKGGCSKDKLCLSLFASPGGFRMNDPENEYERELYPCLKPLFGTSDDLTLFALENSDIVSENFLENNSFHCAERKRPFARAVEWLFRGSAGDRLERLLRRLQSEKIERYMKEVLIAKTKSRVILSDSRVETHFRVD